MITMTTPIQNIRCLFISILQSIQELDENRLVQFLIRNDERSNAIFRDISRFAVEGKDCSIAYIEVLKQERRERRLRYKKNKAKRANEETKKKMFEEEMDNLA